MQASHPMTLPQDCRAESSTQEQSFEKIYSDQIGIVQYVLSRFRFPIQLEEELIQEVFLRYFESKTKDVAVSPRSYLIKTARNLAIDHYRKNNRYPVECQINFDDSNAGDALWVTDEKRALQKKAVELFMMEMRQEPEAQTLVMFYDEERNIGEIADRTQQGSGTVTSKLSRLRKKYRHRLEYYLNAISDSSSFA